MRPRSAFTSLHQSAFARSAARGTFRIGEATLASQTNSVRAMAPRFQRQQINILRSQCGLDAHAFRDSKRGSCEHQSYCQVVFFTNHPFDARSVPGRTPPCDTSRPCHIPFDYTASATQWHISHPSPRRASCHPTAVHLSTRTEHARVCVLSLSRTASESPRPSTWPTSRTGLNAPALRIHITTSVFLRDKRRPGNVSDRGSHPGIASELVSETAPRFQRQQISIMQSERGLDAHVFGWPRKGPCEHQSYCQAVFRANNPFDVQFIRQNTALRYLLPVCTHVPFHSIVPLVPPRDGRSRIRRRDFSTRTAHARVSCRPPRSTARTLLRPSADGLVSCRRGCYGTTLGGGG